MKRGFVGLPNKWPIEEQFFFVSLFLSLGAKIKIILPTCSSVFSLARV